MKSHPIFQDLNTNNSNVIIVWIEDNVLMYLILNWDEPGQTSVLRNLLDNDTLVHNTEVWVWMRAYDETSRKRISISQASAVLEFKNPAKYSPFMQSQPEENLMITTNWNELPWQLSIKIILLWWALMSA